MTRDDIKRKARRHLKGLLLEAYHEARRHAAAGKLGSAASGAWLEQFEQDAAAVVEAAVDETADAAAEALKPKPPAPPADGKAVIPMTNNQRRA